jgi:hypothetical protein
VGLDCHGHQKEKRADFDPVDWLTTLTTETISTTAGSYYYPEAYKVYNGLPLMSSTYIS